MMLVVILFSLACLTFGKLNFEGADQEVEVNLAEERILNGRPTTYTTSGFTYKGKRAQALHLLKARFTASATTYKGHSVSPVMSADLWTQGARYGVNNSGMPKMNQLADFISKNLNGLNVR